MAEEQQIYETDTLEIKQFRAENPFAKNYDFASYDGFNEHKMDVNWLFCVKNHAEISNICNAELNGIDHAWMELRKEGCPIWKEIQTQANQRRKELGRRMDEAYEGIQKFDPTLYQ